MFINSKLQVLKQNLFRRLAMADATDDLVSRIFCGIGTIFSFTSFGLRRDAASASPGGLRECLKVRRVNMHLCGGFETSQEPK